VTWDNDNLANARFIGDHYSMEPALWPGYPEPTVEDNEQLLTSGTRTIWFTWTSPSFTAPTSCVFVVDTWDSPAGDGFYAGLDTWIQIYTTTVDHPTFNDLVLVGSNDDDGNLYSYNSRVQLVAEADTKYYFQVGNYDDTADGTLHFNFNTTVTHYKWTDWQQWPSQLTFTDAAQSFSTISLYSNGVSILPYVHPPHISIQTNPVYSYRELYDGPSGLPSTWYGTETTSAYYAANGEPVVVASNSRRNGYGAIGSMYMGGRQEGAAFILDFRVYKEEQWYPYDDPRVADSISIEYGNDAEFISARFVVEKAVSGATAYKEIRDPANYNWSTTIDYPFLLDAVSNELSTRICRISSGAWEGTRWTDNQGGFSLYPRPFDIERDIRPYLTEVDHLDGATSADPYEQRPIYWADNYPGYWNYQWWHEHTDRSYGPFNSLDAEDVLAFALISKGYLDAAMTGAPVDPSEVINNYGSPYYGGSEYRSILTVWAHLPFGTHGRIGWEMTWRPQSYRLLLPVTDETPPPLRFNQGDDQLGIENASARLNVPGEASNQTGSIQQARSPRIGETGGGSNRYL